MPFMDRIGAAVHVDLPAAGGVLRADARRRRARAQPREAAGRVHHRRHHRQRAAQRARPGARDVSKGGDGRPRQRRQGLRRRAGARSADPFYYRPDHDAPTHPGALAQAQKTVQGGRAEAPVVPAGRQPRRARPGRGPAHAARSTRSPPATGWSRPRPGPAAAARRGERQQAVERVLGGDLPLDTVTTPPTPTAASSRPARPSAASATRHGLHGRPRHQASERSWSTPSTATAPRQARINPAQLAWLRPGTDARDRWVVVFSHNPLTHEALAILDRAPQRRRHHRRQLAQEPHRRSTTATG